jgi:hypothetical protein
VTLLERIILAAEGDGSVPSLLRMLKTLASRTGTAKNGLRVCGTERFDSYVHRHAHFPLDVTQYGLQYGWRTIYFVNQYGPGRLFATLSQL